MESVNAFGIDPLSGQNIGSVFGICNKTSPLPVAK
jgi:hypothetical protein